MARKWFEFKADAGSGPTEVYIYDFIGKCWDDTDPADPTMSSTKFIAMLADLGSRPVNLRVNSCGGDTLEGHAIANAVQRYPGDLTAYIDSIAASAASEIVCAADKVVCAANGMLMVHKASTIEWGNADVMRATAGILDKQDLAIAAVYMDKTGKPLADILALMAGDGVCDGTWFTAQEALDAGFVDQIGEEVELPAAPNLMDFAAYGIRFVPRRFAAMLGLPDKDFVAAGKRNSADDEALLTVARDNINTVLGVDEPDGDPDDPAASAPTEASAPAVAGDAPRTIGPVIAALLTATSAEHEGGE